MIIPETVKYNLESKVTIYMFFFDFRIKIAHYVLIA